MSKAIFLIRLGLAIVFAAAFAAYGAQEPSGKTAPGIKDMLKSRAKSTNERFVLTRRAVEKELIAEKASMPSESFSSQLRTAVVQGWTLFYLPDEDVSAIEQRTKRNASAWTAANAVLPYKGPIRADAMGLDVARQNAIFTRMCKVQLEYRSPIPSSLTFFTGKSILAPDFCRDYMLILAANGIAVRREGTELLAEVEESGKGGEEKKIR